MAKLVLYSVLFLGLNLLDTSAHECLECGLSWYSHNGFCYLMVEDPMSFWDAESYCQRFSRFIREAHLVSAANQQEEDAIEAFAQRFSYPTIWIGYETESGAAYRWTDGSQVGYEFWAGGEPSGGGEECAALRNGHQWNDRGCDNFYPFICKMPGRFHV